MEKQNTDRKEGEPEILMFYATEKCWHCHYDLRKNLPDSWWERTGCPNCQSSFCD